MARPTTATGSAKLPEFVTNPTAADFLATALAGLSERAQREAVENGDSRAREFELRTLSRAAGQQQRLAAVLLADDDED